ncbi:MAG: tetratricopeptide repeat protein, partial [Planctomycetes bacterium]|nr:tetratricopeptide repeat protein [Planctomycetota bacterium]
MGQHFERGRVLFEQSRHDRAAGEFRKELAEEPGNAAAHALLALSLSQLDRDREAEAEARLAVVADPDFPLAHDALATALHSLGRMEEAEASAREAVRLDPEAPTHRATLSAVLLDRGEAGEALRSAEEGLALDPDHGPCVNLRAMALVRLGRAEEASRGIDGALAKEPESGLAHANQGWALLHLRKHREAAEHFREALRLDPGNEWAREGMVEALKARHSVYALLLRYFLWMSRQSAKMQIAVIVGGYVGFRMLRGVARANPKLAPFLMPLIVAYVVFALMTWVADPLFNLLLRFDRFGRFVLTKDQRLGSTVFGFLLLAGAGSAAAGFAVPWPLGVWLGLFFALASLLSALTFQCPADWRRLAMGAFSAATAGCALAGILLSDIGPGGIAPRGHAGLLLAVAGIGFFLSSWVANGLIVSG